MSDAAPTDSGSPEDPELNRIRHQLRITRLRLLEADRSRQALLESRSWQFTAPLRSFSHFAPRVTRMSWWMLKALVWLMTGELARRMRAFREARAGGTETVTMSAGSEMGALAEDRSNPKEDRCILVADMCVPDPESGAGARSTLDILTVLREAGWLITFWPERNLHAEEDARRLMGMGITILDQQRWGGIQRWLATRGATLDRVLLMRPYLSHWLLPLVLRSTAAPISYYGHDLHFARLRDEARQKRDPDLAERAARMLAIERGIWRVADIVLYPSREEVDTVHSLEPGVDARVLTPYAYDSFERRVRPTKGETVLFVGGYLHRPNEDAAVWLTREIMPLVRAKRPQAHLILAGSNPPPSVCALAGPSVEVTGRISDVALKEFYDAARVVAAPLRVGAGVKGKVVEALRAGVPVVTTKVGAQGLPELEAIVPVVDTADGMANAIVCLLSDDAAWIHQSHAESLYAEARFSTSNLRHTLMTAM